MRRNVIVTGTLILLTIAALWVINVRKAQAPNGIACTQEAKICPDGSAVGRIGPDCEFADCPEVTSTSTTGGGGGILPYNSGVQGVVLLGPTCPVMRDPPDPQCADKPYATAIAVYRGVAQLNSVSPFLIGNSDATGEFKFSLPPGSYTLVATGGTTLPRCAPVQATVQASGYTTSNISCDTGIR